MSGPASVLQNIFNRKSNTPQAHFAFAKLKGKGLFCMKFGFLGISYKNAPLDVRDKVSFTDSKKIECLQKLQGAGLDQCMVLSTCNRSELYFFYEEEKQREAVLECYRRMFPEVDMDAYLQEKKEREALYYFFQVTAGIDSMVPGEDQILGQVKEAADFSRTMGFGGKELNKVARDAICCAKRIKTELKISEKPLSVSYVGIQKLNTYCGIKDRTVLVIGSGKTAALALTYLYEYGAARVYSCSRTFSHTGKLKERFPELEAVDYADRYQCMKGCDIVVSATASPHLVVKEEPFTEVFPDREAKGSELVFLDLATPRDVDTRLASLPYVHIINLDTLQQTVEENRREREELAEVSRGLIEEAVKETEGWLYVSRMDDTIESLQQRCGEIVEDSFCYLERKLDLSSREQKIVKKTLHASLQRLLKEPIQELKSLDTKEKQDEYKKLIAHLFQI